MKKSQIHLDANIPHLFASARHTNVECILHIHPTMEIILVEKGTLNMNVGGIEYRIPAGFGVFVPPFERHMFHSELPNECHVLMFSKELITHFFEYLKNKAPQSHMFKASEESISLVDKVFPSKENQTNYIYAQAVLAPLCMDIYDGCKFNVKNSGAQDCIDEAMEYIEKHFTEKLDLDIVAKMVGIHPVTLSKTFSKNTGVHFNFYLQYLRCSYSARLMKSENMTFAEIAYISGFGSIRSFNRAFLNIYGITPTEYKRKASI